QQGSGVKRADTDHDRPVKPAPADAALAERLLRAALGRHHRFLPFWQATPYATPHDCRARATTSAGTYRQRLGGPKNRPPLSDPPFSPREIPYPAAGRGGSKPLSRVRA